jgi:G3E family GTPase
MTETPVPDSTALPVSVITGFLGSGKTTLLNALIAHPAMGETAVLINEFGEVGLDHLLVRKIDETIVLLNSGCLCCSVRGDMITALRDLFLKRVRGEVPPFVRAVIETTGLADPAPIIHTLMSDPLLGARYRLDGVIATIDAVHGVGQLDAHAEAVKQAAMADRLVLTKCDLAAADTVDALKARLKHLNPAAPLLRADHGEVPPSALFPAGLYDPATKTSNVAGWLNAEAYEESGHDHAHAHEHGADVNRHDDRIRAFCLAFDEPLDWERFLRWMEILQSARGESLLRIKGVLNVMGQERPVVIHGVQHVFHPPAVLPAWPSADRSSRVVFITRDLGRAAVEAAWRAVV